MKTLETAVILLDLSLKGVRAVLNEGEAPLQRRLAWVASELERLAGEAYRIADEAGDGTESNLDGPLPGFDP